MPTCNRSDSGWRPNPTFHRSALSDLNASGQKCFLDYGWDAPLTSVNTAGKESRRAGAVVNRSSRSTFPGRTLTLQQLAQFGQRPGIEHVVRREPGAPRLIDSEPHVLERIDGMCIRRDREPDAGELGGVGMKVVQIQPIRLCIDFEITTGLVRGRDHPINVDVVRLALADQTSGRMRQDGYMPVL